VSGPRAVSAAPGPFSLVEVIVTPSAELIDGGGGDVKPPTVSAVFEPATGDPHPDGIGAAAVGDAEVESLEQAPKIIG